MTASESRQGGIARPARAKTARATRRVAKQRGASRSPAAFTVGPRIYALAPGDADAGPGAIADMDRIARMGFTWLLSGAPPGSGNRVPSVAELAGAAASAGLRVMVDVSLPPQLVAGIDDRTDPRPNVRPARLREHLRGDAGAFAETVAALRHALADAAAEGAAGYRCRNAHWLPREAWAEILSDPPACAELFVADTIGAPIDEVLALEGAGFTHLLNSACWWNMADSWFLEHNDRFRRFISTIAFPEPPDGERLAAETDAPEHVARQFSSRYVVAASLSAGVLMPAGYEHAHSRLSPAIGGNTDTDIERTVTAMNALRDDLPVLNRDGPLRRLSGPDTLPAVLLKEADDGDGRSVAVVANPTPLPRVAASLGRLAAALGGEGATFEDHTPVRNGALDVHAGPSRLMPYEARLVVAEAATAAGAVRAQAASKAGERHLKQLADARIAIEAVHPQIDGGRFAAKRAVGDALAVEADIFCDGHEVIGAALRWRGARDRGWHEEPMTPLDNDRWRAVTRLRCPGPFRFSIVAWRDLYATWRADTLKKRDAGQEVALEAREGANLFERALEDRRSDRNASDRLGDLAARLASCDSVDDRLDLMLDDDFARTMARHGPRANVTELGRTLTVQVDRTVGACGAWYELMPRSQSGDPARHGTFDDVIARLPYVRDLGFDVLYFPPIHPIGRTNRKGRNNSLSAQPGDPGSPYAIGAAEGGHDALNPELGTFEDFARLVAAARDHGLEIALDFAIQCSPDHPWIREHPEWFDWRPDGTIRFAENPPKKYEDIVNLHFYRDAFPGAWYALRDVVLFWVDKGVRIFRVDNPHTKPLPFWEWLIAEVQERDPGVVFLAEAFTRPKMMKRLAKVGFTQSYSYFTWRDTKPELTAYLTELTREACAEYMRPNFFVNTPDINPLYLQTSGRPGFRVRLVLAATLSPLYGIYSGFELCEAAAVPGKEEYLDSEKYEIRAWDWDRPGNIRDDIARVNRIRRENPALWGFTNLEFLNAWDDSILAYYKLTRERDNCVLVAVNLDPHGARGAQFEIPLWEFGLPDHAAIEAVDLMSGDRFTWAGKLQTVWLPPETRPFAIWRLVPPGGGATP